MRKKVAILLSGLARYDDRNFEFLKNLFQDYDFKIISSLWTNQSDYEQFKKTYFVDEIKLIKQNDWSQEISKIKYVFGEENRSYKLENIFHMWHSISENIKFLEEYCDKNLLSFDYVCRFRGDLFSESKKIDISKNINKLNDNEIIFPENFHNRGLNDMFFIANFKTFIKIKNCLEDLKIFISQLRPLSSEYFFYHLVRNNSLKIKIIKNFNVDLYGVENKSHKNYELKPTKKAFIPLIDKFHLKYIKYRLRILKKFNL